mmetsp:Transcript_13713/g.38674  ORF Transcript_13713/g.38674 Transcript_13713/m.38674 type:complete len:98 (-) Transcript_13713:378-671(-)|eukprot:scaffold304987_cov18-Tisochrysis_lutea.AAC.2
MAATDGTSGQGAEAFLESLRAENAKMEQEIERLAAASTKKFSAATGETTSSPGPNGKGIRVLSWDPPVTSQAGVDLGSPHRPKVTAERKRDGSFFSA